MKNTIHDNIDIVSVKGRLEDVVAYIKGNKLAKTQKEIALDININTVNLSRALNGDERYLTNSFLKKISDKYHINIVWLLTGEGSMLKEEVKKDDAVPVGTMKVHEYKGSIPVRLVRNKAKAGWSEQYYADEYLEDMPVVIIEADENYKGTYMAFEVDGDSMEPDYMEGDILICREIQRHLWRYKLHIKDWDFVIAHHTNGIMLKEIVAHNVETGIITCRSINPKYEDFQLDLHNIAFLYNVVEVRQRGKRKRWNRAKDFL